MVSMDEKVVLITPFFDGEIAFGLILDESSPFGQLAWWILAVVFIAMTSFRVAQIAQPDNSVFGKSSHGYGIINRYWLLETYN